LSFDPNLADQKNVGLWNLVQVFQTVYAKSVVNWFHLVYLSAHIGFTQLLI